MVYILSTIAKNSKGNAASFKIEAIEKCSDIKSTIN